MSNKLKIKKKKVKFKDLDQVSFILGKNFYVLDEYYKAYPKLVDNMSSYSYTICPINKEEFDECLRLIKEKGNYTIVR